MRFLSLFSGIEAASLAWLPLGWECVAVAEIEPFCRSLLAQRFPSVPNLGDVTTITEESLREYQPIDLVVGGSPCQSFSVAGLRKGLADPRGNLALEFLRVVDAARPRWVLWENVPGILSDSTKALDVLLDGLEEVGYAISGMDILDAQFFGVPQRRRRIFVCAQEVDCLLNAKTHFSGLIAAQCLAESWQSALAVLSAQCNAGAGNSGSASGRSIHSLRTRIALFGLQRAERVSKLLDCLAALLPSSECEPCGLGSDNGRASSQTPPNTGDTRSEISANLAASISAFPSTAPSWRNILTDGLRIVNECIISTSTSETTESRIYICAQAMLNTAAFITASASSSPNFSEAARSCLIGIMEYIDHARSASNSLFTEVGWVRRWADFIRQAVRLQKSLGDIGIRDWGEVLPLRDCLCGHPPPRREAGKRVTGSVAGCSNGGGKSADPAAATAVNTKGDRRYDFETETLVAGPLMGSGAGTERPSGMPREADMLVAGAVACGLTARYGKGADSDATDTILIDGQNRTAERSEICGTLLGESQRRQSAGFMVAHSLRADGFDASEDGTGRGTPIVPVAFDTTQITSPQNRNNPKPGDPCHSLASGAHAPAVAFDTCNHSVNQSLNQSLARGSDENKTGAVWQGMTVRRLTPRECERLQDCPTCINRVIMNICVDHQSNAASVGLRCLRSQSNALPAADVVSGESAGCADAILWSDQESREAAVAVSVRTGHAPKVLAIRSLGKLLWCANGAGRENWCLRQKQLDDFALAIAGLVRCLAQMGQTGKAESRHYTLSSTVPENGKWLAAIFGQGSAVTASDAVKKLIADTKYITSSHGRNISDSGSVERTLLCCALAAISSFILKQTHATSLCKVVLDLESDFTLITYRGKPAADGPRYRALGNSMAVPVIRWIGQRILEAEERGKKEATR